MIAAPVLRRFLDSNAARTLYIGTDGNTPLIIKRHATAEGARKEMAVLERTAACDPSLVPRLARDRLLESRDIDYSMFDADDDDDAVRSDHPQHVVQYSPSVAGLAPFEIRKAANDASVARQFRPLVRCLLELHSRSDVVHCAIAPENIYRTNGGGCCFVDLPWGRPLSQRGGRSPESRFSCPEINDMPAHPGFDVWAIGTMVFLAANGFLPDKYYDRAAWKNESAPLARELCARMLMPSTYQRPHAADVLASTLFTPS